MLVYSRDASESEKQPPAQSWREALWRAKAGRLSVQVLNGFYVTVTCKLSPGMTKEQARQEIEDLLLWQPVEITNVWCQRLPLKRQGQTSALLVRVLHHLALRVEGLAAGSRSSRRADSSSSTSSSARAPGSTRWHAFTPRPREVS